MYCSRTSRHPGSHTLSSRSGARIHRLHHLGNADGSTAVDYTVNCATGYPAITGGGSLDTPVNNVVPAWDFACGYQAAFAILAAFESRRRTGEGAELKIALSDVAFCALSHLGLLAEVELLGRERESIGNDVYGAFGRDFATADGRRIMIAAISAGQWQALVKPARRPRTLAQLELSLGLAFRNEADRYAARESIADVDRFMVCRAASGRDHPRRSTSIACAGDCIEP